MTEMKKDITAVQVKAARALLGWNQLTLANRAKVAASTVADFERGKRTPVENNLDAIREALEVGGVTFTDGGATTSTQIPDPAAVLAAAGKPIQLIDATDLSQWAERKDSEGMLPQFIARLILATTGNRAAHLRFRALASIQLEGWDGVCAQHAAKDSPWLPLGTSGWELTTQRSGIRAKAEDDYKKRTDDPGDIDPQKATFVFVSLKSWPKGAAWADAKRKEGIWADVRVLDADDLVLWMGMYPSVGYWLASLLRKLPEGILPLADNWLEWRLSTRLPLTTEIVLAGRDDEAIDLLNWLRDKPTVRVIQADSPDEAVGFLYSAIDLLPEPHRGFYLMRALRVFDAATARFLGSSPSPLIIIMESEEPGLAARLAELGHHVLVAYGSAVGIADINTVLPKPPHEAFQSALVNMGIAEQEASTLTKDSVRSLAVLRRLIPSASAKIPDWAKEPISRALIPALLAGGWDESREDDRTALEKLSGMKFEEFDSLCANLTGFPDAPLRHAGSAWKVASPRDAWFRLAGMITRSDLEHFVSVVESVLGSVDPRFEMEPNERWLAGVRGAVPKHSAWLSEGVSETLLLLAMFGSRVISVRDATHYPDTIVNKLLDDADATRWYSISDELMLLAEAAPETFLSAIEKSLSRDDRPVATLFKEDGGPLMGRANHSNLLWALEILAWSPDHLTRVVEILASLDKLDPGGTWSNRPKNSLRTIFLLWSPQTFAKLHERLRVLDHLRKVDEDEAWKIMLSVLPAMHDHLTPNPRPRWRDFSVAEEEEITYPLIGEGARELATRLIKDAGGDAHRWVNLVEVMANLAPDSRSQILISLTVYAESLTEDAPRMLVWAALRHVLSHHRSFPTAQWAMPQLELDAIEVVFNKFEPKDSINRLIWLFSDAAQLISGRDLNDWSETQKEIEALRRKAIADIISTCGIEALWRIARESGNSHTAGISYGEQVEDVGESTVIVKQMLGNEEPCIKKFVHGLIAVLHYRFTIAWSIKLLDDLRQLDGKSQEIVQVLLALPSEMATWRLVDSFDSEIQIAYWQKANVYWSREDEDQTIFGVRRLIDVNRAREAIYVVVAVRHKLPSSLIIEMLDEAAKESQEQTPDPAMFQWSVSQLMRRLDESDDVPLTEIGRLEWIYLALLEHAERPPKALPKIISTNPEFFVQVLSAIFRARSEASDQSENVSEAVKALASQAYRLLESWKIVPGTTDSGIDESVLTDWVKESHRLAVNAERGAVGDVYIGRILAYAKADADGVWPDVAVRNVIELMKNDHIENGFVSAVHNKRGVTSRLPLDGGKQERGIANQYRSWADTMKFEWPRTAALLEKVARSFENSAKYHDEHAELTDWSY